MQLSIGLSPWILEDGNYGDFEPGQSRKFALEFHGRGLLSTEHRTEPALVPKQPSRYQATGRVVFVGERLWVCDFGTVLAYDDHVSPTWASLDATASGEIYLGVDPFDYFERHHKLDGIPLLTYRFLINRVILERYPLIYSPEENVYTISDTGHTFEEVNTTKRTRKREDIHKFGSHFILDCTILASDLGRADRKDRFP